MARVFLPPVLAHLTGSKSELEVPGSSVRQIIDSLEQRFPGIRAALVENNRLRGNIAVAVDGEVCPMGLLEIVDENSEIHFVAAVRGGRAGYRTPPHSTQP